MSRFREPLTGDDISEEWCHKCDTHYTPRYTTCKCNAKKRKTRVEIQAERYGMKPIDYVLAVMEGKIKGDEGDEARDFHILPSVPLKSD